VQTNYITEKFTDLAIDWVNSQSKPWFLWLAYNAPHTPFHIPPSNMHSQGNLSEYNAGMDPTPYYIAAIEAMDFQIGRLLENIPPDEQENSVIIFIGDNGTPNQVAQSPYSGSTVKNTLYQGGVSVPMFISGNSISRVGIDNSLLTGTDLFSTIAQIAGIDVSAYHDSKSFYSLFLEPGNIRDFQYTELKDGTTESWAISDGTYKLLQKQTASEEMYHLTRDPYEQDNLMLGELSPVEQDVKQQLETELNRIRN